MKRVLKTIVAATTLLVAMQGAQAVSLKQVYREALNNDPTFQEAMAQRLSSHENLPQAISGLLPFINLEGNVRDERFEAFISPTRTITKAGAHNYVLSLSQPVFNYANIARVRQADALVKQADANFIAAQHDLIIRVAARYFTVLAAEDTYRFTQAERRANFRQLDQAKQRFKVGLDAITSVYDAQAAYDAVVANEITARNNIKNALEQLREITGVYHRKLQPIRERIPLIRPNPANSEEWVHTAMHQNYLIQSARYAMEAAKKNIQANFAGHFPQVNVIANYINNSIPRVGFGTSNTETSNVGLELTFPIFQGGLISSQTRQARFDCQATAAAYERTMREQVSNARQAYNNVIAGIRNIQANRQAIVSALSSVESSEAAMKVGTRTIVDVLDAQQSLFDAQRNHANAQYEYINNMLALKQAAGILSFDDIRKINRWLIDRRPQDGRDYASSREMKEAQKRLLKELNITTDDVTSPGNDFYKEMTKKTGQKPAIKKRLEKDYGSEAAPGSSNTTPKPSTTTDKPATGTGSDVTPTAPSSTTPALPSTTPSTAPNSEANSVQTIGASNSQAPSSAKDIVSASRNQTSEGRSVQRAVKTHTVAPAQTQAKVKKPSAMSRFVKAVVAPWKKLAKASHTKKHHVTAKIAKPASESITSKASATPKAIQVHSVV